MSYSEVALLRDRALRMLGSSKRSLAEGDYDIAAFMADQAVQLYLKSVIFELTGEVPRVHAVRQLMVILKDLLGNPNLFDDFVRENRSLLIRLEEAYISSRYMPRKYDREEAEELLVFAEKVIEFVKSVKGQG
ncbi:HEPN domain-containing protein [Candidatus Bathyarchaeota archaeon]|nr:HEPN domain-containing protein [Candidatus Bathyarchaeota archaeon]MBS7617897.1 HEPN domain-containing protein [Candidatus Bathyarchaeota archaeon]